MLLELALAAQATLAPAVAASPCPPPVIVAASVREWSQNIAVVKSGDRSGLGLVVGWQPGQLGQAGQAWLSVPAHVVFGKGVRPSDVSSYLAHLTVRLVGDEAPRLLCPSLPPPAVNPKPPQGAVDLSFVCVRWDGRPIFNTGLIARAVHLGDDLLLAGPTIAEVVRGKVLRTPTPSEVASDSGEVQAAQLKGIESFSGALTVSPAGVVGQYLGKDYRGGQTLSMAAIRALALKAGVPWQLMDSEFYDCTISRRLCTAVDGELAPASITMSNLFTVASHSVSMGACADIPEGKYKVVLPTGSLSCEPQYLSIFGADDALTLTLRCAPRLGGTWRTEDGDTMLCVEAEAGAAICSGLSRVGFGIFEGRLSANGKHVTLSGNFRTSLGTQRVASGELTWASGRLSGQVQREQNPPRDIKLQRVEDP